MDSFKKIFVREHCSKNLLPRKLSSILYVIVHNIHNNRCVSFYRHTGYLESFHNLMLAYVPKRHAYQYVTYTSLMYLYAIFRNQAYQARIQLAVLDNNAHCLREPAHSRDGTAIHARKFRKQSKKWDVTPVKKSKEYSYVNKIIQEIQKQRHDSCESLKKKRPLSPSNPYHIQHTIGDSDPPSTSTIIENKRSRFT